MIGLYSRLGLEYLFTSNVILLNNNGYYEENKMIVILQRI